MSISTFYLIIITGLVCHNIDFVSHYYDLVCHNYDIVSQLSFNVIIMIYHSMIIFSLTLQKWASIYDPFNSKQTVKTQQISVTKAPF